MLAGMFVAAGALLLVASGAAKLRHPSTAATLVVRLLRRPARERLRAVLLVRIAGAGELVVGLAVLITGARPAVALLALAYLAFAAVTLTLLRAGARASCGCFGSADSPLGPGHLVLNVLACVAGFVAVLRPPGPGVGLLGGSAATAVTATAQAVLLAALGYLAVTSLPTLLADRRALVRSITPQES
ncbi:MauE/DoxX family redox-associated membrane protein [uncultured Jatrophihabitans sp.]|uniref:MauE/DoxX family redox-associated membrane protein n=1 Tax=uncultured Jatrophihabitans sp. TaxID=1610747 RepID=UPI0035CA9B96